MKFNNLFFASAFGFILAKADFFNGLKRAEIFEMTEFNMPTIHIHFSEKSYNRFHLTYKCLYDTHPLVENKNEDCYTAPWVNYTEIVSTLISREYLDTKALSKKQKSLINDPNLGYDDFKSILSAGSTFSVQEVFSQSHTIVNIPDFEEKKASLDFTINGYVLLCVKF